MAEIVYATYANPNILIWARESIGYNIKEAAKKINVSAKKLEKVEQGKEFLTINQLRKAADSYKRPLAIFFLSETPSDLLVPDFRKNPKLPFDTKTLAKINTLKRSIHIKKRNAEDLYEINHISYNYKYIGLFNEKTSISIATKQIQSFLSIDYEKILKLKDYEVL